LKVADFRSTGLAKGAIVQAFLSAERHAVAAGTMVGDLPQKCQSAPGGYDSSLYSGRIATVGSVGCDQAWYSVVRLYDEHWRVG
jgi:hypothetical protein